MLVLLVAAGAWGLAGAALRPVERMRRDAAAHGGTGGERLAVPPTGDELARLAVTLNELLGRLGSSLARQQDLVADAGHELRTPLAVLRTELELASRPGRSQEELAEAVEHAAHEVNRLSQLAEDLLFLARADGSGPLVRPLPTDLAGVLHSAIRSARAHADLVGVTLSVDVAPELTAVIDAGAVRRAIDNLLANAVEYAAGGPGQPQVRLSAAYGNDLHTLRITVEDTGPGFPADFLPHAFDRFRRADPARTHHYGQRGAGLGLAVVREIAEAHGGRAEASNLPERRSPRRGDHPAADPGESGRVPRRHPRVIRRRLGSTFGWQLGVVGVVAALLRLALLWHSGGWHSAIEYDDGVHYESSALLLHGVLPYRDYTFLQPPGITWLLLP